ncbi:hypothetical protein ACO1O0_003355 [Amphichorda felina]
MSDTGREAPAPAAPSTTSPEPHHDGRTSAEPQASHPPFEPLFALLTNTSTNTTIHPRVHYLFSDDDPAILTSAAAAAAAAASSPSTSGGNPDRALIVDLAPRPGGPGWDVAWASSLTPEFAVTGAQLQQQHEAQQGQEQGQQPSPQQQHTQQQQGEGMLRLEGVEREPVDVKKPSADAAGSGTEDVEALMEEFKRRMGVMKRVVGEGERRKEVLRREEDGVGEKRGEEGGPEGQASGGGAAGTNKADDG